MASWNEIRETVGRAADTALQKTGELADMTAMRVKLKLLEGKRDEQYKALGRLTYRQLKTGESQAEKIASVIEALDEIRIRIQVLKDDIERTKQERAAKKEQVVLKAEGNAETAEEETPVES